jgi:hypothetical protein
MSPLQHAVSWTGFCRDTRRFVKLCGLSKRINGFFEPSKYPKTMAEIKLKVRQ